MARPGLIGAISLKSRSQLKYCLRSRLTVDSSPLHTAGFIPWLIKCYIIKTRILDDWINLIFDIILNVLNS